MQPYAQLTNLVSSKIKCPQTHHSNTIKRPQGYKNSGGFSSEDDESNTITSTAGSSTMEKIVEKLKRFGY
ncbi:hypothetical protein MKW92_046096, partial [Papaver armeniacum]